MPEASPQNRLAENIVHFARVLRRTGLPVGPGKVLDAIRAVETAGLNRRDDFYWTLHATLVDRHEFSALFDQAFHVFWRDPKLLERMMALMLPELTKPDAGQEETSRRLAEALVEDERKKPETSPDIDIDIDAQGSYSASEALRAKDFDQMSVAELAQAKAAIARLRLPLDEAPTRRMSPNPRGRLIDMRKSLRASLRSHGTIPLHRKAPRRRRPSLVILCDISGSMSVYARLFLHFMHATTSHRDRVHSFVFGTKLTHISRHLRHRDVDEALQAVSTHVEDWDGGTRIGETLHRFNKDWARRVLGQGAIVLLITDGLDRDAGEGLEPEITRLHRSCRRLIWLNPLLRYDKFEPKSLGIRALLPHVDEFRPVHNINAISALVTALSAQVTARKMERRAA